MPIIFENDNDIIIHALECVVSYARRTQQIFVAQCVWWLASIIGLEQGLILHIDKLQDREDTILPKQLPRAVPAIPRDLTEDQRVDQVIDNAEQYLRESKRLTELSALKISGKTRTGRLNPLRTTKKSLREAASISKDVAINKLTDRSETRGIGNKEISRRNAEGECLRCAWPSNRKGSHRVKNCIRPIKLDTGTAGFPKKGESQEPDKSPEGSDPEDSFSSEDNID